MSNNIQRILPHLQIPIVASRKLIISATGIRIATCAIVYGRLWILIFLVTTLFEVEAAPTVPNEIPFECQDGFIRVKVSISESAQPLNFLLDTGAGVSTINLATAKRIGLKLGQEVTVHGVETTMPGHWQEHMYAKAGGVRLPSAYLTVDLEKLSHSCEVPVDGLIGADFFRGKIVQIDFDAKRIRVLKKLKGRESNQGLPLQLRPCGMRVPISVDGHANQWVRLDTGCATALQWVTANVPDQCTHQMAIGLAEISIPQTRTMVNIGDNQFEDVPTGLHEKAIFPGESGLLGNGLLSRFSSVTIDARAGRVFFEQRKQSQ